MSAEEVKRATVEEEEASKRARIEEDVMPPILTTRTLRILEFKANNDKYKLPTQKPPTDVWYLHSERALCLGYRFEYRRLRIHPGLSDSTEFQVDLLFRHKHVMGQFKGQVVNEQNQFVIEGDEFRLVIGCTPIAVDVSAFLKEADHLIYQQHESRRKTILQTLEMLAKELPTAKLNWSIGDTTALLNSTRSYSWAICVRISDFEFEIVPLGRPYSYWVRDGGHFCDNNLLSLKGTGIDPKLSYGIEGTPLQVVTKIKQVYSTFTQV
ncbi:MAG: hypothetical protein AB7Q04_14000 [Steroidobacteraceae bacterium]